MTARKDPADFLPRGRPRSAIRRRGQLKEGRPAVIGAYPTHPKARRAEILGALVGPCEAGEDIRGPKTRAECIDGPRPCPWTTCRHHLAIDVTRHGGLRITWPELQINEVLYCCALDVADSHPDGLGLDQIGAICNLTNERVRQIQDRALAKLTRLMEGYR